MSRHRAYAFTINNYTDEDVESCKKLKCRYIILGDEIGENGTKHIQGYVYFNQAKSFASVKKKIPRGHIEPAKGNAEQNREYCSKQSVLFTSGEPPKQGKRTDLELVNEVVKDNPDMPMRSVIKSGRANYQTIRIAEKYLTYFEEPRDWETQVYWFYGASGTGKSREAFETAKQNGNYYVCNETNKWWDGYDGHEIVIIDDMRKNFSTYNRLLNILDRYECRVEVKGGHRQLRAKTIYITSCYSPEEMFDNREDKYQLLRRITEIKQFL